MISSNLIKLLRVFWNSFSNQECDKVRKSAIHPIHHNFAGLKTYDFGIPCFMKKRLEGVVFLMFVVLIFKVKVLW